ncbi:hypothetical protein COJ27_03345 [Bacillus cereus]|uniref:Uncharacterized protein n=1 Tax=Bacillus cereus TaxID=1396 RepID=A0A9X6VNA3_BACCE|nr:hypothetical protein CN388_15615 [Bacillus cereus]PFC12527.1 hypothetical protein CN284_13465 [Bacillus cereus]PFD23389.1 hypothetical protein CN263_06285 [Bacillus cereus]PFL69201.1 hypothetical protein COJ27_03345 [Bacillus cereus]PGW59412.1 hypothetical protein COE18_24365 [Bacillus cereus]
MNTCFFLILLIFFVLTYISFFLWKHLKIIKYMPALVGFISILFIFIWKRMTFGWEGLGFGHFNIQYYLQVALPLYLLLF